MQILACLTAKYRQMKVGLFFQNQKNYLARKGSRIKVYFATNSVLQIYVHNLSFIIEYKQTKKFTRLKIKVPFWYYLFTIKQKYGFHFTYSYISLISSSVDSTLLTISE